MFTALSALLARSVAPVVAEQLARSGVQALQARLGRDPSLAPATSAEIVAAINHYNAAPERVWTRQQLFAFGAFFVSAEADGGVGLIETPARIVDYVLRGPRPGEDPAGDRAVVARELEAELESVRALMARYMTLLTAEPAASFEATATTGEVAGEGVPDPAHARLNALLTRVATPAGAALARARASARQAADARRARALVEESLELLHAGGVGLAQAEDYLLRKGHPVAVVRAAVARRVGGG